jgi:hypothetical protein
MTFDVGSFVGGLSGAAVAIVAIIVGARYAKRSSDQAKISADAALGSARTALETLELEKQKYAEAHEVELRVDLTLVLGPEPGLMVTLFNSKATIGIESFALLLDRRFIMLEPQNGPHIELPVDLDRYRRHVIVIPADLLAAMFVEDIGMSGQHVLRAFITDSREVVHISGEIEFDIDKYYTAPTLLVGRPLKARDELLPMITADPA